jgi:hypothetical protein
MYQKNLRMQMSMTEQIPPKPRMLLDQLRDAIRLKHYSYGTEKAYVHWARRYILNHNKRHHAEMGALEIEAFLSAWLKKAKSRHPPRTKLLMPFFSSIATY